MSFREKWSLNVRLQPSNWQLLEMAVILVCLLVHMGLPAAQNNRPERQSSDIAFLKDQTNLELKVINCDFLKILLMWRNIFN